MDSLYADGSLLNLLYAKPAIILHSMVEARHQSDIRAIERSASSEVSHYMRSEFGLQSAASDATWAGDSLTVTLREALTPIGQVTAQSVGGDDLLETAYDSLYHLHQSRIHALISQVVGLTVRQSSLKVDAETGNFSLTFFFASH